MSNLVQSRTPNQMNITTPTPDTEQTLFYTAINALRIAGQENLADDLDQRMENIIKTPKVAIYIQGGMVQGIRSNIGQDLEVEIVDDDWHPLNDPDDDSVVDPEDRWQEIQTELEFGNY